MAEPFLGEIRIFAGNYAPQGWALCNGQLLAIASNTALFSILGTTFGGNGVNTFALPNLQSSAPLHWGTGVGLTPYVLGESGGSENATLLGTQMPLHNHTLQATAADANNNRAAGNTLATSSNNTNIYSSANPAQPMNGNSVGPAGGSQPHPNIQPFLTLTFIIALQGIFPTRG